MFRLPAYKQKSYSVFLDRFWRGSPFSKEIKHYDSKAGPGVTRIYRSCRNFFIWNSTFTMSRRSGTLTLRLYQWTRERLQPFSLYPRRIPGTNTCFSMFLMFFLLYLLRSNSHTHTYKNIYHNIAHIHSVYFRDIRILKQRTYKKYTFHMTGL